MARRPRQAISRVVVGADHVAGRAVGAEGVDVEDEQSAASEVGAHAGQGLNHLAGLDQVVDGVVEAGDEIERAEARQAVRVGDVDDRPARRLLGRRAAPSPATGRTR